MNEVSGGKFRFEGDDPSTPRIIVPAALLCSARKLKAETKGSPGGGAPVASGEGKSQSAGSFGGEELLVDLKRRSVRGGAITLTAQALKFLIQMGSTMVLARLLRPADFGLVSMVVAVSGFAAMFKDAGLSMATIQQKEITQAQVSTLFWINAGLSMLIMLVVAALAPILAWFYDEPRLVGITLALSSTFLFGGLTVQHHALLRRQMRFKDLATIEILSLAAGIGTAILMAMRHCTYWSLVGQSVATVLVNWVLVWWFSAWRPGRPVRGSGVGPMLAFGGYLTGKTARAKVCFSNSLLLEC